MLWQQVWARNFGFGSVLRSCIGTSRILLNSETWIAPGMWSDVRPHGGAKGDTTEEPPADTRPDVNKILGAVIPAPSVLAPIAEEGDATDTTMPEIAESGP